MPPCGGRKADENRSIFILEIVLTANFFEMKCRPAAGKR